MSNVITPTNTPSLLTPSGSAAPNGQLPTLRRGDKNDSVKLLQTKLGVEPLGIFGPKTEEAVKAFQKKNGLTADGVVGKLTWEKINGLQKAEVVKLATLVSIARPQIPAVNVSSESIQRLQINAQNSIQNLQNQILANTGTQNAANSLLNSGLSGAGNAIGQTAQNLAQNIGQNLSTAGKDIAAQAQQNLQGLKDVGKNLKNAFPKQLPKVEIPKVQLPKLPKFKKKELPEPKKFKKRRLKDKLAAAKAFGQQLKDTAAGYKAEADKIRNAAAKAKADLQNTVNQATNAVQNAVGGVQSSIGNTLVGLTNTVGNLQSNITNTIANVPGTLTTNLMTNLSKVQEEQLKKLQESSKEAKAEAQPKFDKATAAIEKAKQRITNNSINKEEKPAGVNNDKPGTPPTLKGFTYEFTMSGRKPVVIGYIADDPLGRLAFEDKNITEQAALAKFIEVYKDQYPNISTIKRR